MYLAEDTVEQAALDWLRGLGYATRFAGFGPPIWRIIGRGPDGKVAETPCEAHRRVVRHPV